MNLLIRLLVNTISIFLVSKFLDGVHLDGLTTAFIVALVLGIINAILKPILVILTLPITILTLGLFTFVINALLVLLASRLVPGFEVANFWTALLFSLLISLVSWLLNKILD